MDRIFFALGAICAFLGVALGAFGTHGLSGRLEPGLLTVFETGVRYQMYHAFGLMAAAWVSSRWPGRAAHTAGWLLLAGTVVFSGSLYALSLSGVRAFGAITPIGGLAQLAGWICLIAAAGHRRRSSLGRGDSGVAPR